MTSSRPKRSTAQPTALATSCSTVTSHGCTTAVPPASSTRRTVSFAHSSMTSAHTTWAPSAAKASAEARPTPAPAPVMTTDFPSSSIGIPLLVATGHPDFILRPPPLAQPHGFSTPTLAHGCPADNSGVLVMVGPAPLLTGSPGADLA